MEIIVRQQPPPKRIQAPSKKPLRVPHRTLVIQPIAVEFRYPRRRDYNAFWKSVVEYIERKQKRTAKGGSEAVVRGRFEG